MSTYKAYTLNPNTKKWEYATWIDDYFAHHHYGVEFSDGMILDPLEINLKTREPTEFEKLKIDHASISQMNSKLVAENKRLKVRIDIIEGKLRDWESLRDLLNNLLNKEEQS